MKRLLAAVLCLTVLLALLAGCGAKPAAGNTPPVPAESDAAPETVPDEPDEPEVLRVGFARVSVTPDEPVNLQGYGNSPARMSSRVLSEICATALAFTDGSDNTVILISLDTLDMDSALATSVRGRISKETGVDKKQILVSCTHTHSAPAICEQELPAIEAYYPSLVSGITEAAKAAMDDRTVAQEVSVARTQTEGLTFVRRYLLNDGDWMGPNCNPGRTADIVGHESEPDEEMQVIRIRRESGKDVLLCNFQAHPTMTGGRDKGDISADFIGYFRDEVEAQSDCHCVYFTGAAGNLTPGSYKSGETRTSSASAYGELLADCVLTLDESAFTPVETGRIGFVQEKYQAQSYRPTPSLLPQATEIWKLWQDTGDCYACVGAGEPYGIHSPYHANAIISGLSRPNITVMELDAFTIGDVAFITAPYEMFDTNGVQIKEGSPYAMTFVCTCANDYLGYVVSELGKDHQLYENDITHVVPGTGDLLSAEFVKMLEGLHR